MISIRIALTLCFVLTLVVPGSALAALVVDFSATPLFAEANILPGDAVERTITITNTGLESELVEFAFENIIDGPMSSVTELAVWDDTGVYVDSTFAALFAAGPYALGDIAPGASQTYTFGAGLPAGVGNVMQNEQFGFDVRIGFVGAEQVTDASRSFSGSGSTRTLQLFNEAVTIESGFGGAFVTWNSNAEASTYLVCGDLASGPFALSAQAPLFGYEFAVAERVELVSSHGLAVTAPPGEYECRPAGRVDSTDGFTVGDPVRFTLAGPAGEVAGVQTSLTEEDVQELLTSIIERRPTGSVFGVSSKGAGDLTYEEFRAELDERDARLAAEQIIIDADGGEEARELKDDIAFTPVSADDPDDSQSSTRIVVWVLLVSILVLVVYWVQIRRKA